MIHVLINALAATAGGGVTYVRNVIPFLAASPVRVTILLPRGFREHFRNLTNVEFMEMELSGARRYWYEQSELTKVIHRSRANVLVSTGNFALRKSPVPQILLSRNSIYTSDDYFHDLWRRHEYRMLADTYLRSILAKKSICWADVTVAPSESFAAELSRWTGTEVISIHHGFDHQAFTENSNSLSEQVEESLAPLKGSLKLLFVSHYNYYRNFETLIRALPIIRDMLPNRPVKLLLTCHLQPGKNPGAYRPDFASNLIRSLGVSEMVVELGTIPYEQLHYLYRRADLYVTAAYTETFAHPLVEAMSSGVPVLASDIPVHREVCEGAAVYFERFSPEKLAESVVETASSPEKIRRMIMAGAEQVETFSWKTHVERILDLCERLVNGTTAPMNSSSV